ncbi:IS1595 family transposase [Mucilaginibacter sp. RS28]|uniref:IS1595 family transposase n=1 Tax=Mucilaginibacter straminoryzae TaxID=2932774 RepID=A0A9X2B960_9SPHI|nr:IS1595 family transposase [Mucilaginibacter straminoryzae]MCJ8209385.1 IS1595 family transposase [Mucilaginibacter straminoryzae]
MQNKILPFKNLIEVANHFNDKQTCLDYLIKLRWPNGATCPFCSHDKVYHLQGANKRYKCAKCRKHFSVTKGTIFENSVIPLQKWFVAIYLITSHKKGISSVQLAKDVNVTQKTAWFMLQRVRHALKMRSFNSPEKIGNVVEIDETYVGGNDLNRHANKKKSAFDTKTIVLGAIERKGEVRLKVVPQATIEHIIPFVVKNIKTDSVLMTDEWTAYNRMGKVFEHLTVNHSQGVYVQGSSHTNTIENFWGVLKRGIYGIYHQVSAKHMQNYLEEFAFRFNNRKTTEAERFNKMVSLSKERIKYADLIRDVKKAS